MVSQPLRWFDDEQSDLEAAANQAIAACGGDARETVKTLIVVNHFLETELENYVRRSRRAMRGCRLIGRIGMTRTGCLIKMSNCSALSPARAKQKGHLDLIQPSARLRIAAPAG
jgi:hypothetical protein